MDTAADDGDDDDGDDGTRFFLFVLSALTKAVLRYEMTKSTTTTARRPYQAANTPNTQLP